MKKITEDELILLYYAEHSEPGFAAKVAASPELSTRFEALCAELKLADSYQPPERGEHYGLDVWQRIASQLTIEHTPPSDSRIKSWLSSLSQPRFSYAGALSLALVVVLAFTLGRNGAQSPLEAPPGSINDQSTALFEIDSSRLLTHSVSGHLEQVNIVLTQFANSSESSVAEAGYALDMLVANRLYRLAAARHGKHKVAAFLADLEPLLIELAYDAQSVSPHSRERMQQEVRNGLLFRVRVMSNQLNKSEIST